MHTLTEPKQAHKETRNLLSRLRLCDTVTTVDATLAINTAIEHVEMAVNALRVAVERENNRMVDLAVERCM